MPDSRFFENKGPFTLAEIVTRSATTLTAGSTASLLIKDVAPIDKAGADELSFLDNRKYIDQFKNTKAGACIIRPEMAEFAPKNTICLLSPMPYKAYALAAQAFYPVIKATTAGIAATAVVDSTAIIGQNTQIDAGAVIDADVQIGDNCHIKANAVISNSVEIGDGCIIGPNTTLSHCVLGERVVIYPGAQIGQRGFGFAIDPAAGFFTVPQLGRVIIGDDVEVGSNTTIDRGAGPDTSIGNGTRIDNLVQIGHNVEIGQHCVIVAQVGISGSTKIADFVMMGGQSASAGHLTIGTGAKIGAQSGIMRNVEPGTEVMGSPAIPSKQFFRQIATLNKMTKKGKK